jgi:CRISPR-associated protein Cmr6
MAFYPFCKDIIDACRRMPEGNFGLWYNKFIPLNSATNCKPANDRGDDKEPVEFYYRKYNEMKKGAESLLSAKHQALENYCGIFSSADYAIICFRAKLISPLITGMGESHPNEVSMVFDHNLGIPYIPASGVKGIVRFAHALSIFLAEDGSVKEQYNQQNELDETEEDIPDIFGGEKTVTEEEKGKKVMVRGRVIFLDAYPERIPDLKIDIMNPHYGDYYADKEGKKPPADYLSPSPIKFLTVSTENIFVFRAIAERKNGLAQKVNDAFKKALTEEGVGAKTAVGYGRFEIDRIGGIETDKHKNDGSTKTASVEIEKKFQSIVSILETWNGAHLFWSPGNQELSATYEGKRATAKGEDLVPESLRKALFEKRKSAKGSVTVEKLGKEFFIIRKVEPHDDPGPDR